MAAGKQAAPSCSSWPHALSMAVMGGAGPQFWLGDIGPPADPSATRLRPMRYSLPSPLAVARGVAGRPVEDTDVPRPGTRGGQGRPRGPGGRPADRLPGRARSSLWRSSAGPRSMPVTCRARWSGPGRPGGSWPPGSWAGPCGSPGISSLRSDESGDIAAARRSAADSLAWAREAGDLSRQASGLAFMADLDLRAGDTRKLGSICGLPRRCLSGLAERDRLISCLDLYGYLCAARSQWADAVTIWSAFSACLEEEGSVDPPLSGHRRQERLRQGVPGAGGRPDPGSGGARRGDDPANRC